MSITEECLETIVEEEYAWSSELLTLMVVTIICAEKMNAFSGPAVALT